MSLVTLYDTWVLPKVIHSDGMAPLYDLTERLILNRLQSGGYCTQIACEGVPVELHYRRGILRSALVRETDEAGLPMVDFIKTLDSVRPFLTAERTITVRGHVVVDEEMRHALSSAASATLTPRQATDAVLAKARKNPEWLLSGAYPGRVLFIADSCFGPEVPKTADYNYRDSELRALRDTNGFETLAATGVLSLQDARSSAAKRMAAIDKAVHSMHAKSHALVERARSKGWPVLGVRYVHNSRNIRARYANEGIDDGLSFIQAFPMTTN